jgi:hypothetical protein
MLDKIIFGDNQFFGINHMSEEKAQALSEKFHDSSAITEVIDIAYDCGIRALMLNSNERAREICDYLRNNISKYSDLYLFPSIPYPHKYANSVAQRGLLNTLVEVVFTDTTPRNIASVLVNGSLSYLKKDAIRVMQLLIDSEMKIFQGLNIKCIFLQNILTDLLLGFGIKDVFLSFLTYINKKYSSEAGFITLNLPRLAYFLTDCGIENPIICSSINKIGYLMNPNKESYENLLIKGEIKFRPVAMSIFASGAIKPQEAIDYVCGRNNIRSLVFGASKREHMEETIRLIESYS